MDNDKLQYFANLTYDTMPPPITRAKLPQHRELTPYILPPYTKSSLALNEIRNLEPLQSLIYLSSPHLSPDHPSRQFDSLQLGNLYPGTSSRPDPRYVCLGDPDPAGANTPPTPTWKAIFNETSLQSHNESAIRKHEAIISYTAPSIYKIDQFPNTNHISAGELPIHHTYYRHSGGTIKCDECKSRGRAEVYKCHHCVAQICNECIDKEIANEIAMDDYQFTWKGTQLHGAFKLAYLKRKDAGDAERSFEGWVTFGVPSTGAKYRVYVSIEVVPRAQKVKNSSNNKLTRNVIEIDLPIFLQFDRFP